MLLKTSIQKIDLSRERIGLGVPVKKVCQVLIILHRLEIDRQVEMFTEGGRQGGLPCTDETRDSNKHVLQIVLRHSTLLTQFGAITSMSSEQVKGVS